MKRTLLGLLACAFLLAHPSLAQDRTVTGRVTSQEDGTSLPGVSIVVKGTTIGTTTDSEGNYRLSVPSNATTLVFSFIGLLTQEVDVSGRTTADVSMASDTKQLSEVVVVGYGTQERADVTGSISQIKGTEFQNLPVTSYDQALQGRVAGMQISSSSGEIGAAMSIKIRGASSITASNKPLIVIDGFPVTNDDQTNFSDNNNSNPLADLNPNDIATVSVLKDASASAIYGARASNGVIIITTKRGAGGKTKFNFNYSTGTSQPTHLRKFLTGPQYIQMFKDASKYALDPNTADADNPDGLPYTQDAAGWNEAWGDYGGGPYSGPGSFMDLVAKGANDNWNKRAFRTGRISQYDLSATGGTEKTKFYASFGYLDQEGIIVRNALKRLSGRFNIDQTVNEHFQFGLSMNQVYSEKKNVPENNQFNSPLESNAITPIIPIFDRSGQFNDSTYYANPFRAIAASKDISTTYRNFSTIYGSWQIVKGLTARSEAGVDFLGLYEFGWNGSKFPLSAGTPSSGKYGTSRVINYTVNNTLTYNKIINDVHDFTFLIGQSFQKSTAQYAYQQGQGLPTDAFQWLRNAGQNTSFGSYPDKYTFYSIFARVNYKFGNKYILGASVRDDGSSRFGVDAHYGWFPAVSAGWVITEEDFIKNLGLDNTINFLKLKSSFGYTGNAEIGNYASKGLYTTTYFGSRPGLMPSQLANNSLTWEKARQTDIGLEYTVLKGRVSGGVDYYNKYTYGLLLNVQKPTTSGYPSALRNLGAMTNKGWDIYINTKNIDGAFKWTTSFNISTYTNKVNELSAPLLPSGRSLNAGLVGQPLGVFYGVPYAGVDPATGDALFRLADGTTTSSWSQASQTSNYRILGNPNPKHYGGITNTFEYKGIELSVFGQWSYGNKIYQSSGVFQSSGFTNFGLDNQTAEMFNYWRKEGDITNVPRPQLDMNNGARTSGRYVSDGSYFRFKTVTLGYNLPASIIEKIRFSSVRIYVTGQNILTFTNYKGNDPEVNYTAPNVSAQTANLANGVDYYSAPQAKSLIFGVKLGF